MSAQEVRDVKKATNKMRWKIAHKSGAHESKRKIEMTETRAFLEIQRLGNTSCVSVSVCFCVFLCVPVCSCVFLCGHVCSGQAVGQ